MKGKDTKNTNLKKISLRFRMDKERDRTALAVLDTIREQTGASYNEIILDRILADVIVEKDDQEKNCDAEQIADLVANRLKDLLEMKFGHLEYDTVKTVTEEKQDSISEENVSQQIDDNVLSFLSSFGI